MTDTPRQISRRFGYCALALSTSVAALVQASPALAQVASGPATTKAIEAPAPTTETQDAEQESGTGIGDIIVTAQRRSERLLDVPIAVTAFSSEALEARNITNVNGLTGLVPNVKIFTQGYATSATVAIRGSVVFNNAPYFEPVVGLYVDGVYIGKARGAAFDNVDLEGMEVLRGPQGTLYGRNTLAGALNMVTRKPTGELGGAVKFGVGDYGQFFAQANLNLPAIETGAGTLKVKVSGRRERRDGTRNIANPLPQVTTAKSIKQEFLDSIDSWAGRVAVRYEPSADITFDYSYDYSRQFNSQALGQLTNIDAGNIFDPTSTRYNGIPLYLYVQGNGRALVHSVNGVDIPQITAPQYEHATVHGHALTATFDLGGATLKSISSFRKIKYDEVKDFDGSPLQVISTMLSFEPKAYSQELQLSGSTGDLVYTAGLYYYSDDATVRNSQSYFGSLARTIYSYGTDAYAAYGQLEFSPSSLDGRLTFTGGLRYNRERKEVERETRNIVTGAVTVPFVAANKTFDGWQPSATVKFDLSSQVNIYAKYAKGFKSGGFGAEAPNAIETAVPFRPEGVNSYEIGLKGKFFDNRFQLTAAAFYDDHTDLQLSVFDPRASTSASVVRNAGSAVISGFEIEGLLVPVDGLRIQGTVGYLHTKYKEFLNGNVNVANDRAFPYAPELTGSASVDARLFSFGDAAVHLLADYTHSDPYFVFPYSLDAKQVQNAQRSRITGSNVVDLRLRLSDVRLGGNSRLEASFWVKNAFNDEYTVGAVDFGASVGGLISTFYGRPRMLGGDVSISF